MIRLESPNEELVISYLDFFKEIELNGEKIWEELVPSPGETNAAFVKRLIDAESNPAPGRVAESTFWACKNNIVVGSIALRHALNENLKEFGGHIGYEVRPSCRNQGIAKEMLRQVLQTQKAKEIGSLLLTCAPDNLASNKTIQANGGVLSKTLFVKKWKRDTNYYWINI